MGEARELAGQVEMQNEADRSREKPRSDATEDPGNEHRRHQEKVEGLTAERRRRRASQDQSERDKTQRQHVNRCITLLAGQLIRPFRDPF